MPLSALLEAAGPLPNARYAAVSASDFTVAIALDDANAVLLATRLNGADLPEEHGGPCRLVSAGQACYAQRQVGGFHPPDRRDAGGNRPGHRHGAQRGRQFSNSLKR